MIRTIDPAIWRDEFFTSLPIFDRLLWIGILNCCADDQGRMPHSAALVRSDLFPTDDVELKKIKDALDRFIGANKLHPYFKDGKDLLQVINWWKYQKKASWMGASQFPAPDGWIDRIRCHAAGNTILEENWKLPGGFDGKLPTQLPSALPIPLPRRDVNVNDDVNDNVNVNDNHSLAECSTNEIITFSSNPEPRECEQLYRTVTDQINIPQEKKEQTIQNLGIILTRFDLDQSRAAEAITPIYDRWCSTRSKNGRLYSKVNPGWLTWALDEISAKREPPRKEQYKPCDPDCSCKGLGMVKDAASGKLIPCPERKKINVT